MESSLSHRLWRFLFVQIRFQVPWAVLIFKNSRCSKEGNRHTSSLSVLMESLHLVCFKVPEREAFILQSKVTEFKTFINNVEGLCDTQKPEKYREIRGDFALSNRGQNKGRSWLEGGRGLWGNGWCQHGGGQCLRVFLSLERECLFNFEARVCPGECLGAL